MCCNLLAAKSDPTLPIPNVGCRGHYWRRSGHTAADAKTAFMTLSSHRWPDQLIGSFGGGSAGVPIITRDLAFLFRLRTTPATTKRKSRADEEMPTGQGASATLVNVTAVVGVPLGPLGVAARGARI